MPCSQAQSFLRWVHVRTYHDIRGRLLIPFVFDGIIAEFDGSCCYEVLISTILD
jgi:hypothetical protein